VPAAFTCRVDAFDKTVARAVMGDLVNSVAAMGFSNLRSSQVRAWAEQLDILDEVLGQLRAKRVDAGRWTVVLEYSIPRRQRRPDLILLADDLIFVAEFKIGGEQFDESSRWQAYSYALDLRDFHAESHDRVVVPFLVATDAKDRANPAIESTMVCPVQFHNARSLAEGIELAYARLHDPAKSTIDAAAWLSAAYRPTLTIIEAAESLYSQHGVHEISHRYADNLEGTTDCLLAAIETAQRERRHIACFVTGVPGAGKTLRTSSLSKYSAPSRNA